MLKSKLFLALVVTFLVLPMVLAQLGRPVIISEPIKKQGEATTISLPCTIGGNYCSVNATCRTTIINPNGLVLINNYNMTRNNAVFEVNLSANQTEINGEYEFNVVCSDNGGSISRFLKFHVTPNGEMPTTAKGILYIGLFFILIVFFVLSIVTFIRTESMLGKFTIFFVGWVLLIAISFIAWNMSVNFITSTPFLSAFLRIIFLFFLIATVPLILSSFVWVGYMMLTIKEIEQMMERGIPEEEAWARKKGKRWK